MMSLAVITCCLQIQSHGRLQLQHVNIWGDTVQSIADTYTQPITRGITIGRTIGLHFEYSKDSWGFIASEQRAGVSG